MQNWTFRPAGAADWPAIAQLLCAAELPLDGAADHTGGFLLAEQDGALLGAACLERYGDAALLRSVAVAAAGRGAGLGQELVRRLLGQARATGVRTVVLLTTTAAGFFPRFGFRTVTRADVPPAVQASAEFRGACPATATVMRLDLAGPPVLVRPAAASDAAAIARIYNQGIADRTTLETEPRTAEERAAWLAGRGPLHPVVVAVQEGEVAGWAALNPFSPRAAYRFVADLSIYVAREQRGQGVGAALMRELIARAGALGYHKLVLTTFPHSTAALGLYTRFGFRHVGDYREQGLLEGEWVDTRLMELLL